MHAFQQHPYRNEVLGSKEDLLGITRDDLYQHYRKHYQPSNAILCIAGDISPNSVLEEVENLFGGIPSSPLSKSIPTPEKSLNPGNQLELEGPGEAHYLEIAWRCPAARDPDFFAYTIIESLLSGPSSLNMFGSGDINNRTSRLYQALVEEDFAASVFGDLSANIDPGVYKIFATIRPDGDPWAALKIINEQIRQITAHELSQREIDRAIKQASALFAYVGQYYHPVSGWAIPSLLQTTNGLPSTSPSLCQCPPARFSGLPKIICGKTSGLLESTGRPKRRGICEHLNARFQNHSA